jgi:uncharacterized protein YjbJ (UPF0337 family)
MSTSFAARSKKRVKSIAMKSSAQDRIEGTARTIAGVVKEEAGKATGHAELQEEGRADQFVGRSQSKIGRIKAILGS